MTAGSRTPERGANATAAASPGDSSIVSDETLIALIARERDRAAFRELFDRYATKLRAFMRRGGASLDEAEEAAQEALISVWRRADTFDPGRASAAAWLFTIARNRRVDLLRRGARPEPDPEDPTYRPSPPQAAEETISENRRDETVRAALARLSAEQRLVIRLSFFEGLAHAEIAEKTGLPLGTVKSRLRLAFQRLRAELGAEFAEELQG